MSTQTKHAKNVVDKTKKTFSLATLVRELTLNPKIVRARFRRYHDNDNARFDVVRKNCELAKQTRTLQA